MIAEKLQQAREAKGLSQEHVAAQLSISLYAYKSLEEGDNTPTSEQIITLAELLGRPAVEWLEEVGHTTVVYNASGDVSGDLQAEEHAIAHHQGHQNHTTYSHNDQLLQEIKLLQEELRTHLRESLLSFTTQQEMVLELLKKMADKQ